MYVGVGIGMRIVHMYKHIVYIGVIYGARMELYK